MKLYRSISTVLSISLSLIWFGCSGNNGSTSSPKTGGKANGGIKASGGETSSGGLPTTGGMQSLGGSPSSGGKPSSGGMVMGGKTGMGGALGTGGSVTGGTVGGETGTATGGTAQGGSSSSGGTSGGVIATGGVTGKGGASSSGGSTSDGACSGLSKVTWTGASSRPMLTDAIAPCFTTKRYLGDWDPTSLDASTLTPTFTVAADGSGSHKSVQEAVKAATGSARVLILVKPGKYRETVCVQGATPITLYGADVDATKVTIAYDNVNGKSVGSSLVNECQPASGTFGTTTSSTFFVKSNDFQAINMTIANDYAEPGNGTAQAVAMTTHGDKLQFQNVRFLGNQDTLQPGSSSDTTVARSYYKSCFVEGDTDFIFGNGTAVFDECSINYVGVRKTGGSHLAPSTDKSIAYGFLFVKSHFIAGTGAKAGAARLGRAWDVSNKPNSNGAAVIRDSEIDNHVSPTTPWGESTQSRPFSADGNRFYEYKNTGAGAAK